MVRETVEDRETGVRFVQNLACQIFIKLLYLQKYGNCNNKASKVKPYVYFIR